jgi:hypothetical protein
MMIQATGKRRTKNCSCHLINKVLMSLACRELILRRKIYWQQGLLIIQTIYSGAMEALHILKS